MISFPNAKINLGLRVIRKRGDGYHDLETVFYPVPLCDILEIVEFEPTESISFTKQFDNPFPSRKIEMPGGKILIFSSSGLAVDNEPSNNLCVKACTLFDKNYPLKFNVAMHLHKIIPMGAGLGGGSSDAVEVLKILSRFTTHSVGKEELYEMAVQLGSDCAFFIENKPCIAKGRGEQITPLDLSLKGYKLVMVKPPVHVSSAEAFGGISPVGSEGELEHFIRRPVNEWKNFIVNDFENHIFLKYPVIEEIKRKLYEEGAVYAAMSGSGSTVFGLFENNAQLKNQFPGCFYFEEKLN